MDSLSHLTPQSLIQHEAFVLRLARSLTRDESQARDLAQDTWIAAMSNPPRTERIRGWLAQVVRNRAYDLARSEQRRTDRERRSARNEAESSEAASSEQLELQHGVVAAVLALDDPYRSTVIAIYYEGLSPAEYAKTMSLPPSTVRSQLSRALEQLRGKLDREYGSRSAWSIALTGFCAGRLSTPASAGVLAWTAGAGAAAIVGAALWLGSAPPPIPTESLPQQAALSLSIQEEPQAPAESRRQPIEADEADSARVLETPLSDDPALLIERMRQIKTVILDRALEVDPSMAEAYAHLGAPPIGGLVRLLDREQFGIAFNLPWMREGGSYYSFTKDIHDFNTLPQISLEGGWLVSRGDESLLLDLGRLPLDQVPKGASHPPDGLTFPESIDWKCAWVDLSSSQQGPTQLREVRSRIVDDIYDSKQLGWQGIEEGLHLRKTTGAHPAVGHSYLLRSRIDNEVDILVAFEVVQLDEEGCTLAWKLLREWSVQDHRDHIYPLVVMKRVELAPIPIELEQLTSLELHAELDRVRDAGHSVLYNRFPPELELEIETLRKKPGVQVARVAHCGGEWSELHNDETPAGVLSLTDGQASHNPQLSLQRSWKQPNFRVGGDTGAALDLGTVPLGLVDLNFVRNELRELGDLMIDTDFTSKVFDAEDWRQRNAVQGSESEAVETFVSQLREHGIRQNRTPVLTGHSYFLRSVDFSDLDVLAAVHVLAVDEYGAILAWRVFESKFTRQ